MKFLHTICAISLAVVGTVTICADAQVVPSVYVPDVKIHALSDNGAYAISKTVKDDNVDNPRVAGGTLIDMKSHAHVEIPALTGWADINDIADDGTVVGSYEGKPGYWRMVDGVWTTCSVPINYGGGCFTAVTPDAHYAVGYFMDRNNEFYTTPMMYDLTTGQRVPLTNLPTVDLSGIDQHQNVFYGISPDGRYVLGQMSESYLMPVALMSYVYDTTQNTWRSIGYDYNQTTQKYTAKVANLHFIDNQRMSCDGAWVTGQAYMVYDGGDISGGTENYYPYRYNIANDQLEVFQGPNDANIGGNQITADGVILGCTPAYSAYPTAMIHAGNFFVSLDQVIQQVYGMRLEDLIGDYVTGKFQALSADGLTAVMTTNDNCYVITMPEQFADAARRVNLLANYTLSIPANSSISRIAEVKITFDRAVDCLNLPQNIKLIGPDGNVVRSASGFQVSPTSDYTVVVTFRSTALTPGETYTIDIPENMIWLKEDKSIKTERIQISYTGRPEGPVVPVRITPASGAAISEFNSTPDVITVTFDTPVVVSDNAVCTLYNADSDMPLAYFAASASGSTVTFYPTATYYLYKGSKYKVVINAGSVTDLSGSGPCDEITLTYNGTYVRQISSDDLYLFNSTCDNYDDFMFWKDRFDEPAEVPAAWGFTAQTPWVLVRQNEESTDMALAAHSMFKTPAESNDWLITPQLYLPDANTYLAIDAQSYKRSTDDVLKIYVMADNAVYNYFSDELEQKFLAEGQLIYDEVIPAGAIDEGLEGEWTHITYPLSDFAGKNVYIAFVNKNYAKSAIFLDNIQVVRNMSMLVTNQTPTAVVNADRVQVSGIISAVSEIADYKGINIKLMADGTLIDEIDAQDVTLKQGDTYNFKFAKAMPLTVGEIAEYTIQVSSGTETLSYTYTVKDLTFEPVKRVVLEEFTGSACGNCPLGIQAISNLERLFPDNFIPLTLRTYNGDRHSAGAVEYTSFLGLDAAPSGRINRGDILMPALRTDNDLEFFGRGLTDSDGAQVYLWADAVQDELNVPAEAEVEFTASYDPETGDIKVPCTIRYALHRSDMSLGVFAVVLEDKLQTYQLNYFNSYSYPALGEWGVGGAYSQSTVTTWLASDVVRYVVNDRAFNGTVLQESEFTADTEYGITLRGTVPNGRLNDPSNCKVVVMLIDRTTGHVINANRASMVLAGISGVETDDDTEAEYYNLQGVKVLAPETGNIYIRVVGGKAQKIRY